jgi:predicted enzyme related to lactoylglutathione lyase
MSESNTFIWNELVTADQASAGPFYSELFGWERQEIDAGPLGTYTVFRLRGRDVAGMMNPTARDYGASPPPRWIGYIAVDDADRIAAQVPKLGGTVLEPPHGIPGVGRICMFQDVFPR